MVTQGRELRAADIDLIQGLMAEHPRIVLDPDIPIHRLTFADCLQDGQQMLPRDTGRRVQGLAGIE